MNFINKTYMDDRAFFDRLAPQWDAGEVNSTPQRVGEVLDLIGLNPGMRVLDLGTGTGVLLPHIAERIGTEGHITAVDYSEGMLSRAREKFSGLTPKPEFLNLDFENETIEGEFDLILLYCVYPHLHTPEESLKWLRKVNLKHGGRIIIAFPTDEEFINSIHRERHSESDFLPPADELAARLSAAGLEARALARDYVIEIR